MKRDNDIDDWWRRWLEARDPVARDRLIVHYSPLVKFVAGRVGAGLPNSVDPGDLVSAGVFGLIDAVERFDQGRGVKFETFAVPRIRGAVFDGLRSLDWVPRSVRSRAREVETAFTELESRHGRAPSSMARGVCRTAGSTPLREASVIGPWWPARSRARSAETCPTHRRRSSKTARFDDWCAAK